MIKNKKIIPFIFLIISLLSNVLSMLWFPIADIGNSALFSYLWYFGRNLSASAIQLFTVLHTIVPVLLILVSFLLKKEKSILFSIGVLLVTLSFSLTFNLPFIFVVPIILTLLIFDYIKNNSKWIKIVWLILCIVLTIVFIGFCYVGFDEMITGFGVDNHTIYLTFYGFYAIFLFGGLMLYYMFEIKRVSNIKLSSMDYLKKIKKQFENNEISQEEYETRKKEFLGL